MKCFASWVTNDPKCRPTMQCHLLPCFLSKSFLMNAAMSCRNKSNAINGQQSRIQQCTDTDNRRLSTLLASHVCWCASITQLFRRYPLPSTWKQPIWTFRRSGETPIWTFRRCNETPIVTPLIILSLMNAAMSYRNRSIATNSQQSRINTKQNLSVQQSTKRKRSVWTRNNRWPAFLLVLGYRYATKTRQDFENRTTELSFSRKEHEGAGGWLGAQNTFDTIHRKVDISISRYLDNLIPRYIEEFDISIYGQFDIYRIIRHFDIWTVRYISKNSIFR